MVVKRGLNIYPIISGRGRSLIYTLVEVLITEIYGDLGPPSQLPRDNARRMWLGRRDLMVDGARNLFSAAKRTRAVDRYSVWTFLSHCLFSANIPAASYFAPQIEAYLDIGCIFNLRYLQSKGGVHWSYRPPCHNWE